jgi:arginine N-succinyltransferase
MAQFPEYFDPKVIAEMRGIVDDTGYSPLWDALGRHFFEVDYPTADYQSMVNKRFIADLMPKHPIYIPLLPPDAQAVIGKVHPQTEPALKMLQDEGFTCGELVDIFEGGPVVQCGLSEIRSVRESVIARVSEIVETPIDSPAYVLCNARQNFRACFGPLEPIPGGTIRIGIQQAMALNLRVGDSARFVTARPVKVKEEAADGSEVSLY